MANSNLVNAKRARNDEFYTQYADIQKEIEAYLEYDKDTFKDKVVYCNCDDPFESNFFRYFVLNFKRLGLKKLITTSYKPSPIANTELILQPSFLPDFEDKVVNNSEMAKGRPKVTANKFIISDVGDMNGDGAFNLTDIAEQLKSNKNNEWTPLKGVGDFRSPECIELLKQSDVVVTNPPFSLFREYVAQLVKYDKKFLIIGAKNTVTNRDIFPLFMNNKMWVGTTSYSKDILFIAPQNADLSNKPKTAIRVVDGVTYLRSPSVWFTNLDHGRRHQPLNLRDTRSIFKRPKHKVFEGKAAFDKYDNYDAIEIPFTDSIPSDYNGVMGVPVSFLDKYSPDQFEILGSTQRGCHDRVPDTKKYDDYWEVRQDGTKTGSSGGKTNENGNLEGNDGKKNYFINKDGHIVQSAFSRIFIRHRKVAK